MDRSTTCPYCGEQVDEAEYGPLMGRIRRRLAEGPASLLQLVAAVDAGADTVRAAVGELQRAGVVVVEVRLPEYLQPEEIGR